VHKGLYWYSTDPHSAANLTAVPVSRVKEIQELNRKGIKPDRLVVTEDSWETSQISEDLLKNNSLTRFDTKTNQGQNKHNRHKRKNRKFHDKRNK
jgi:hypothetical protein